MLSALNCNYVTSFECFNQTYLPPRKLEVGGAEQRRTTGGEGILPPNVNNKSLRSVYYPTLSPIVSTSSFSVHRIVDSLKEFRVILVL